MFYVFTADRQIRHRACALKDSVHAIIKDELDEDFEKICEEIKASRIRRGDGVCVWKENLLASKLLKLGVLKGICVFVC